MLLNDLIKELEKTQAEIARISPTFYTAFPLNAPATKNELLLVQKMAPFPLPEDYLELLEICNGWRGMFGFKTHLLSVEDQQRPEVKKIVSQFYEQEAEWTEEYMSEEIFPIAVSTLGWNSIVFIHSHRGETKYVYVMENSTVLYETSTIRDLLVLHLESTSKDLEYEKKEPLENMIQEQKPITVRTIKDLQGMTEYDVSVMESEEMLDQMIAILFYQKEIVDLPLPAELLPHQVVGGKAVYYWMKRWAATGDPFNEQEAKMYTDKLLTSYSHVSKVHLLEEKLRSLGWDVELSYHPCQCMIKIGGEIKSRMQGNSVGEVLCKAAIVTYLKETQIN